jgi:hypothetical protein
MLQNVTKGLSPGQILCYGLSNEKMTKVELIKLHTELLQVLHSSANIIRVTKSRIMRWVGHIACIVINAYKILVTKPG